MIYAIISEALVIVGLFFFWRASYRKRLEAESRSDALQADLQATNMAREEVRAAWADERAAKREIEADLRKQTDAVNAAFEDIRDLPHDRFLEEFRKSWKRRAP